MATRAKNSSKTETHQKAGARTRRLRNGTRGELTVRPGTIGGGRALGQQNKLSRQAKEDILDVFTRIGGVTAMAKWARENRGDFYTKIYARLIPKDVAVSADQGLEDLLTKLAEKQNGGDAELGEYVEVVSSRAASLQGEKP